jgi:hypothetical protein
MSPDSLNESGPYLIVRLQETMKTLLDILKKDSKGRFQWLETASDIETAKARVMQLSSGSQDEFVVFRETDLKVVATSKPTQTDSEILRELTEA